MNDLEKFFTENTGNLIHKWKHYFDVYDRHFSKYRGTDVHIVEFGVFHGGSLKMWKHYFGPRAKIYGVDINPNCKQVEEDQIEIFIGDQADRQFLKSIHEAIPRIDILIDDGGHTMEQQINTFEVLFPHISMDGIYLCEDLHTSYWRNFGGGYKRKNTFIEYSKNFIDYINAWHSENPRQLSVSTFTQSVNSLHYYDSIIVIEKKQMEKPFHLQTGLPCVPSMEASPKKQNIIRRFIQWFHKTLKKTSPCA